MNYLEEPLSIADMREQQQENGYVRGIVKVELASAIDNDFEGWLDILSEALTGTGILMEVDYAIVGYTKTELFLEVTGDATMILLSEEEEEQP